MDRYPINKLIQKKTEFKYEINQKLRIPITPIKIFRNHQRITWILVSPASPISLAKPAYTIDIHFQNFIKI